MEVFGEYRRVSHEASMREAVADALKALADGLTDGGNSNLIWEDGSARTMIVHRYPLPRVIQVTIEHIGDNYTAHLTIIEEAAL